MTRPALPRTIAGGGWRGPTRDAHRGADASWGADSRLAHTAEADALLARVAPRVPARLSGMVLAGANPRLRLYRYAPGERHGAHWDTVVELPGGVRSLVTLVFYLNDGFEGGETDFPELSQQVSPRAGRALLFQHRILHEATSVRAGEKLVLRTDVLYRPPG